MRDGNASARCPIAKATPNPAATRSSPRIVGSPLGPYHHNPNPVPLNSGRGDRTQYLRISRSRSALW